MRILLAAFACRPNSASEDQIGWSILKLLSRNHEVGVITHPIRQQGIEHGDERELGGRVKFLYAGKKFTWHPVRLVAQIQNRLIYLQWLQDAQRVADGWLRRETFDLMHHITITTWRLPPVSNTLGVPLVWGPLGGAATYPSRLLSWLSPVSQVFEAVRTISSEISILDPRIRRSAQQAAQIICVNRETVALMKKMGKKDESNVHLLNAAFFSEGQISQYREILLRRTAQEPLRAFAGGFLVGSKGIHFALHALARVKEAGCRIPFTVASEGPERSFLERKAQELGLGSQVVFRSPFAGHEYRPALADHNLFLLPSFREGSAITILEAMLCGQVPLVVSSSTQGESVTPASGFAVPWESADQIIGNLASALLKLAGDPDLRLRMAREAHRRVAEGYSEEHFRKSLEAIYFLAVNRKAKSTP